MGACQIDPFATVGRHTVCCAGRHLGPVAPGPICQIGPGPIWARALLGPGPFGPGPVWARARLGQGLFGPGARLGPGPIQGKQYQTRILLYYMI